MDRTPRNRRIINTVLTTLFLACILFCHGIFHSTPSLGYLVLLYAAIFMVFLLIPMVVLSRGIRKVWVGLITISAAIALFVLMFSSMPNNTLMFSGQLTTAISFVLGLALYPLIWKK